MIQYIRGELAALEEDRIIVDVGGIGYGIFMSVQSMSSLPPVGSEVRIYTRNWPERRTGSFVCVITGRSSLCSFI